MAEYKWNIGAYQKDSSDSDFSWNIGADQSDAGGGVTYVDAEAAISGTSTLTATGLILEFTDASATITASGSITAYATANIRASQTRTILVAVGNSQLYYEES